MRNDDKPIANPFVVLREEFDDWAVLFNPDTGHGFGLNPTGVYAWKLVDGEHTIDDLLEDIHHHADSVPEEAGEHIKAFVDALVAKGLAGLDSNLTDRATPRLKTSASSFSGALSEVTPFTYEPPQLVDFLGEQTAAGKCCGTGTSPQSWTIGCCGGVCVTGGDCGSGACASGNCNSTGTSAAGAWCDTGSSPTFNCGNGSSPGNGHCAATGSSASGTCTSGSTASSGCTTGTST